MPLLSKTGSNFAKYNVFVEDAVRESMFKRKPILFTSKNTKHIIRKTKRNQNMLESYLTHSLSGDRKALNTLLLEDTKGNDLKFGDMNSSTFKAAPNKGDVAEGIFAAAIYAKFLSKAKTIKTADVKKVLTNAAKTAKISGKKGTLFLKEKSKNKNGIVDDIVSLSVTLASTNMESLIDSSMWKDLDVLFKSSVKYVNKNVVESWATMLYENNQRNNIEILADGTENQMDTKVDVYVKIDNSTVDINVSLKVGDVKQFGQIGGIDWDNLLPSWKKLGINIASIKKQFYEKLADFDSVGAITLIFDLAAKKTNINVDTVKAFVKEHATKNEKAVTLVNLSDTVKIYDFDKLKKANIKKIGTELKYDSNKKPTLIFSADNADLFQLRLKIDNRPTSDYKVYVRTLVEKLNGMNDLLAQAI